MKKLTTILLTVFFLQTSNTKAQITLDTALNTNSNTVGETLGYLFKIVQISSTESKYFVADTNNNTFNLYNMDFTPFLTNVHVPQPFMNGIYIHYQVIYISRTLFDCDSSNIEYAYTNPLGGPAFYIMRTDGTQLLKVDSAYGPYGYGLPMGGSDFIRPIVNTSSGSKLFLIRYYYDSLKFSYSKTQIYSLCGSLPTETIDFSAQQQEFVQVFPNPSSSSVTFKINPPDNTKEYDLVILDSQSKVLRREKIGIGNYQYTMDLKDFSSGNYIYSLCTKDKSYQAGKFVLTK